MWFGGVSLENIFSIRMIRVSAASWQPEILVEDHLLHRRQSLRPRRPRIQLPEYCVGPSPRSEERLFFVRSALVRKFVVLPTTLNLDGFAPL